LTHAAGRASRLAPVASLRRCLLTRTPSLQRYPHRKVRDFLRFTLGSQQQREAGQRRPQRRTTRQLQVVYQAVCQSCSHPSADEVYWYARRVLPQISLGTVYHNLQRLVDEGKISVFLLGERTARYDPTTTAHAHFVCQHCGQVEDVFLDQLQLGIDLSMLARRGYRISTQSLVMYGRCPSCTGRASARLR